MIQNPHPTKRRVRLLLGFFAAFLLLFAAVLYDAQVVHGSENRAKSIASNASSETVTASRGIITDRNGKVLVSNRLTYTLVFSDEEFESDTDCNDAIFRLLELCRTHEEEFIKVKGHADNAENNRCDEQAVLESRKFKR